MKKLLIVTYLPWASPRVPGLARYLPEYGWEPVVFTPELRTKPEDWLRVIETPYRDSLGFLRNSLKLGAGVDDLHQDVKNKMGLKLPDFLVDFCLTRGGEIINYPDLFKGWLAPAVEEGAKVIEREGISVILSSSSPVTSHVVSAKLKARCKKPWLADLRDLWSQNHNYRYSPVRKWYDRRLEIKTLSGADALVTVSRPWADKLQALHRGKQTYTITNGFDPEAVHRAPVNLTGKFTLTYTGMVYPGKQSPGKLFSALSGLLSSGALDPADVEIRFYGPVSEWLDKETKKFGLSKVVTQYGPVSRQDAREKQAESQLLVLFDWDDAKEPGVYPGKVFEYLAAGRPILVTGGAAGNVISRLMAETKAGTHAFSSDEVKDAILKYYREYKSSGSVASAVDAATVNRYSYRETARQFSEILDSLTPDGN
jgi:glycosyltransferase involved in cell wall biosynthesis